MSGILEMQATIERLKELVADLVRRIDALESGQIAAPPVYHPKRKLGWPKGRKRGRRNGKVDAESLRELARAVQGEGEEGRQEHRGLRAAGAEGGLERDDQDEAPG